MNFVRGIVSGRRNRLRDGEHDLDLSFITPRILAMGFPASGAEGLFRNHIADVAAYLNGRFKESYLVINLSERSYDNALFGHRVVELGFPDHHAPPVEVAWALCLTMDGWLQADPSNIVAVHCLAGKGRTGAIIACYMLFSGALFHRAQQMAATVMARAPPSPEPLSLPLLSLLKPLTSPLLLGISAFAAATGGGSTGTAGAGSVTGEGGAAAASSPGSSSTGAAPGARSPAEAGSVASPAAASAASAASDTGPNPFGPASPGAAATLAQLLAPASGSAGSAVAAATLLPLPPPRELASQALEAFRQARGEGVEYPSQERVVRYFARVVHAALLAAHAEIEAEESAEERAVAEEGAEAAAEAAAAPAPADAAAEPAGGAGEGGGGDARGAAKGEEGAVASSEGETAGATGAEDAPAADAGAGPDAEALPAAVAGSAGGGVAPVSPSGPGRPGALAVEGSPATPAAAPSPDAVAADAGVGVGYRSRSGTGDSASRRGLALGPRAPPLSRPANLLPSGADSPIYPRAGRAGGAAVSDRPVPIRWEALARIRALRSIPLPPAVTLRLQRVAFRGMPAVAAGFAPVLLVQTAPYQGARPRTLFCSFPPLDPNAPTARLSAAPFYAPVYPPPHVYHPDGSGSSGTAVFSLPAGGVPLTGDLQMSILAHPSGTEVCRAAFHASFLLADTETAPAGAGEPRSRTASLSLRSLAGAGAAGGGGAEGSSSGGGDAGAGGSPSRSPAPSLSTPRSMGDALSALNAVREQVAARGFGFGAATASGGSGAGSARGGRPTAGSVGSSTADLFAAASGGSAETGGSGGERRLYRLAKRELDADKRGRREFPLPDAAAVELLLELPADE